MLKFLALSYHFSFGLASLLVLPFALLLGVLFIILCDAGAVRAAQSDLVLAVFVAADICLLIIIIIICLRGRTIKLAPTPAPAENGAVDNTAGAFDTQVPQEAANSACQEVVVGRAMFCNDGSQGIWADDSVQCSVDLRTETC